MSESEDEDQDRFFDLEKREEVPQFVKEVERSQVLGSQPGQKVSGQRLIESGWPAGGEISSTRNDVVLTKIEFSDDCCYIAAFKLTYNDGTSSKLLGRQDRKLNKSYTIADGVKIGKLRTYFDKGVDFKGRTYSRLGKFELYSTLGSTLFISGGVGDGRRQY